MYHYFFEGDTVRLAYWRIDYDENMTAYANTEDAKFDLIASLSERGLNPIATAIDQTGNEWIDGMCFTDHSKVEEALRCGYKSFICKGDEADIANTLSAMNDATFAVGENGVWNITVPGVPSTHCYNIVTCLTASSVDNQLISINGSEAIPLLKDNSSPVMSEEIMATLDNPLALQINITKSAAYIASAKGGSDWKIGEVRSFAYSMDTDDSVLLCDGSGYDIEKYPLLHEKLNYRYCFPSDSIARTVNGTVEIDSVASINGYTFAVSKPSQQVYRSTDGINWEHLTIPYARKVTRVGDILIIQVTNCFKVTKNGETWIDIVCDTQPNSFYTGGMFSYSPFDNSIVVYQPGTTDRNIYVTYDNFSTYSSYKKANMDLQSNLIPLHNGWIYRATNREDSTTHFYYADSIENMSCDNIVDNVNLIKHKHDERFAYFVDNNDTYALSPNGICKLSSTGAVTVFEHTEAFSVYARAFTITDNVHMIVDNVTSNDDIPSATSYMQSLMFKDDTVKLNAKITITQPFVVNDCSFDGVGLPIVFYHTSGSTAVCPIDTNKPALPHSVDSAETSLALAYIKAK